MKLQNRIALLSTLRDYLVDNGEELQTIKHSTSFHNGWFTVEFIDTAIKNITEQFLNPERLESWVSHYLNDSIIPKNVGIVMAGNIPLVGFHDFLCVFISGHKQTIKLS